MADLGVIEAKKSSNGAPAFSFGDSAVLSRFSNKAYTRVVPDWLGSTKPLAKPINGVIFGTVTIQGLAAPNTRVELYYRATGQQINVAITNSFGQYRFDNLDPAALYTVVAKTSEPYNAVIYDKLTPELTG